MCSSNLGVCLAAVTASPECGTQFCSFYSTEAKVLYTGDPNSNTYAKTTYFPLFYKRAGCPFPKRTHPTRSKIAQVPVFYERVGCPFLR